MIINGDSITKFKIKRKPDVCIIYGQMVFFQKTLKIKYKDRQRSVESSEMNNKYNIPT